MSVVPKSEDWSVCRKAGLAVSVVPESKALSVCRKARLGVSVLPESEAWYSKHHAGK